jgi:hypothetical protein
MTPIQKALFGVHVVASNLGLVRVIFGLQNPPFFSLGQLEVLFSLFAITPSS